MQQNILDTQHELNQDIPGDEKAHAASKFTWRYTSLGLLLFILVATGAFILGRKTGNTTPLLQPENIAHITPITSITPTSFDQMTQGTYESKISSSVREGWVWKPFIIHYPTSWSVVEEKTDQSIGPMLSLKVTKNDGSYFTIIQGFGEGGRCLYPEESDYSNFQGMGLQFTSYEPITIGTYNWRLSTYKMPDELSTHAICEVNSETGKYGYGSNVVGIDKIKLTTDGSKNEFIEMLKQIEIK